MKFTDEKKRRWFCQLCILGFVGVSAIAICDTIERRTYENVTDPEHNEVMISNETVISHGIDNTFEKNTFSKKNNLDSFKVIEKELTVNSGIEKTENYTTESVYKEFVAESNEPGCNDVSYDSINADDSCKYVSLSIPNGDCSSFMFMDYRTLTDISSKQWELQQYGYDGNYGIRMVDGCYCVATSSMYGDVGDKIRVTTDRGNAYWCIIADIKGYDSVGGWYHVNSQGAINLIEFIVDSDYIPNECWQMGDMGIIDDIGGNVVKIERSVDWE